MNHHGDERPATSAGWAVMGGRSKAGNKASLYGNPPPEIRESFQRVPMRIAVAVTPAGIGQERETAGLDQKMTEDTSTAVRVAVEGLKPLIRATGKSSRQQHPGEYSPGCLQIYIDK